MRQHDENGRIVAQFLAEPEDPKGLLPRLKCIPSTSLRGGRCQVCGMISFETGSLENAKRVLESVRLCTLGESLGGVGR